MDSPLPLDGALALVQGYHNLFGRPSGRPSNLEGQHEIARTQSPSHQYGLLHYIVVTHLIVTSFESKHYQGLLEATTLYKLSIHNNGVTVLEITSAGSQVLPYSQMFSCYMQEVLALSI